MLKRLAILCLMVGALLSGATVASAWDGYDWEKGSYVEIERGQLVRPGRTVEAYDYDRGSYRDFEVDSMRRTYRGVELEVTDSETGESRTFEMED